MKKRTFFVLFAAMLAFLLVPTLRELPKAPPLPETLEQDARGWYWGECADSLAAAVPDGEGLRVLWVDKANPSRLFFKKCKTADPAEALKQAAKRPLYTTDLHFDLDKFGLGEKLMLNTGMAALEAAGAQGNGGRWVDSYTLSKGTHKAGAALLMAAVFEVAPEKTLESLEENLHPAVWEEEKLAEKQDFHLFAGLVKLQWYHLWGSFANFGEGIKSTDAADYLYVIP